MPGCGGPGDAAYFQLSAILEIQNHCFSGSQGFEEDEADAECQEAGALVLAMEKNANQLKTNDVKVHCRASRRTRRTRSAGRRWRCSFS